MRTWLALLLTLFVAPAGAQTVYFSSPPITLTNGTLTSGPAIMTDFNRIVSDGNLAYTTFLASIAGISGTPTPSGAVLPFDLSACPAGWIPSDGTAGTVDLRGKFIRTTQGTPAVGTVQADTIIQHKHQVSGTYARDPTFTSTAFPTGTVIAMAIASGALSVTSATNTGTRAGAETRPINVALLYCQKS